MSPWSLLVGILAAQGTVPAPPGKLVDLGGYRIHVYCTGRGTPTVVVEGGFDEFSSDWSLVQSHVESTTRVCTYDRAGYAWSDPGPMPRTFDQINLELREAMHRSGERAPFVLVGHSFGGPVVREFALSYPRDVAGLVLVDSAHEAQRVPIQGKAVRLRASARGRAIPKPSLGVQHAPRETIAATSIDLTALDPTLEPLPMADRLRHAWAEGQPALRHAQDSERDWSPEYFARWSSCEQARSLGSIPLVVLTRAESGYGDDLDVPASELDAERKAQQHQLTLLSQRGSQRLLRAGHDMHVEAPADVAQAILDVVREVRSK